NGLAGLSCRSCWMVFHPVGAAERAVPLQNGCISNPFLEERLMSQSNRSVGRLRPQARSLAESLRQFLTPAVWKQAQATRPCGQTNPKRSPRWQTQPLVLVLLFMTWCCGDSQAECFETARATCSACLRKRRRPGKTLHGFQKALAKLPLRVL